MEREGMKREYAVMIYSFTFQYRTLHQNYFMKAASGLPYNMAEDYSMDIPGKPLRSLLLNIVSVHLLSAEKQEDLEFKQAWKVCPIKVLP